MKITLEGISHSFADNEVLKDINLEIQEGELFTLLGPSGCGKTTILRIIAGFLQPAAGRVYLGGQDITGFAPEKRNIGTVFQNYALFPHMNVEENVQYGLKLKHLPKGVLEERVQIYLDLVGLYTFRKRKISELSGGQQQRVALARSLAIEPQVLLLDEPMSNLDAALRDRTRDEIHILQQKLRITTLFITHDQKEAISISDKIAVMNGGCVVQTGSPREVYGNPANGFSANFIGESNVFDSGELRVLGIENHPYGPGEVFIRPEALIMSQQYPLLDCMEGHIDRIVFNGSTVNYEVKVGNRRIKIMEINRGQNSVWKQMGSKVFLSI